MRNSPQRLTHRLRCLRRAPPSRSPTLPAFANRRIAKETPRSGRRSLASASSQGDAATAAVVRLRQQAVKETRRQPPSFACVSKQSRRRGDRRRRSATQLPVPNPMPPQAIAHRTNSQGDAAIAAVARQRSCQSTTPIS